MWLFCGIMIAFLRGKLGGFSRNGSRSFRSNGPFSRILNVSQNFDDVRGAVDKEAILPLIKVEEMSKNRGPQSPNIRSDFVLYRHGHVMPQKNSSFAPNDKSEQIIA